MAFGPDVLSPQERVRILRYRLTNLINGSGDFRPSNRSVAIKECKRCLDEARADLAAQQEPIVVPTPPGGWTVETLTADILRRGV